MFAALRQIPKTGNNRLQRVGRSAAKKHSTTFGGREPECGKKSSPQYSDTELLRFAD